MVPFNRPIPESKPSGQGGGILGAWVQAEKMIQIALMLPCAGFIGWLAGAGLDLLLHQKWMATAGIVLGILAGLAGAIRMAMFYASDPQMDKMDGDEDKGENSGKGS